MSNWKRIVLIVFVLVGGAISFGLWSLSQFNLAFDNLGDSNLANLNQVYNSIKKEVAVTTEPLATQESTATSTPTELILLFPKEETNLYAGCTYPISWQSSTTINSLETTLIDAGTREPAGPVASGLAKENNIEKEVQSLKWKVGIVWPGEYFVEVSKINGSDIQIKTPVFTINRMPENIDVAEQKTICEKSNGSF